MPDNDPRSTPQDRRSFLATLGGAAIAASGIGALACISSNTQSESIPSSSQTGGKLGPIGLQLYSVRDEMKRDVAATLARVARIGYKEVEFAGYFDRSPTDIRALLDADGLTSPSSHVALAMLKSDTPAVIAAAKVIGHEYIVVPSIDAEMRKSLDDWRGIARTLNVIGAAMAAAGLRLGYHNHDFEFDLIDGQKPYDVLLAETNPALVTLEMDLYWATKAGQDPVAYFAKYPGRFRLVHVKDSKGPPNHEMTEVGAGSIDWKRIFAHRTEAGIQHYIVEHDNPKDPWASIEASYRYLSALTV
jgi:sugar phosphate isomerase/epimerase